MEHRQESFGDYVENEDIKVRGRERGGDIAAFPWAGLRLTAKGLAASSTRFDKTGAHPHITRTAPSPRWWPLMRSPHGGGYERARVDGWVGGWGGGCTSVLWRGMPSAWPSCDWRRGRSWLRASRRQHPPDSTFPTAPSRQHPPGAACLRLCLFPVPCCPMTYPICRMPGP